MRSTSVLRQEGGKTIPDRGMSLCPRPWGMLAHTQSLLVMPDNVGWTELMLSESIMAGRRTRNKVRCLDSIPKPTGTTQHIPGGNLCDQIFRKSTDRTSVQKAAQSRS